MVDEGCLCRKKAQKFRGVPKVQLKGITATACDYQGEVPCLNEADSLPTDPISDKEYNTEFIHTDVYIPHYIPHYAIDEARNSMEILREAFGNLFE